MLKAQLKPKHEYAFDVTGPDAKILVVEMITKASNYSGRLVQQISASDGEYVRFEFKNSTLLKSWLASIKSLLK